MRVDTQRSCAQYFAAEVQSTWTDRRQTSLVAPVEAVMTARPFGFQP
jgi:hypothetical protein